MRGPVNHDSGAMTCLVARVPPESVPDRIERVSTQTPLGPRCDQQVDVEGQIARTGEAAPYPVSRKPGVLPAPTLRGAISLIVSARSTAFTCYRGASSISRRGPGRGTNRLCGDSDSRTRQQNGRTLLPSRAEGSS